MFYTEVFCISTYIRHYKSQLFTSLPQSQSLPHSDHTTRRLTYQSSHQRTRPASAQTPSPAAFSRMRDSYAMPTVHAMLGNGV